MPGYGHGEILLHIPRTSTFGWGSITRIERELSRDAATGIPCSHRKFWCKIQCQWPRGLPGPGGGPSQEQILCCLGGSMGITRGSQCSTDNHNMHVWYVIQIVCACTYVYSKFIWNWCHVISNHSMSCQLSNHVVYATLCLIMVHCIILC